MNRFHAHGILFVYAKTVALTQEFERGAIKPVTYLRSHNNRNSNNNNNDNNIQNNHNKNNTDNNNKNKNNNKHINHSQGKSTTHSYRGATSTDIWKR